jgi:multimeric flavodoxin WrbA
MKVMMVNGSPHEKGCTYTALEEVAGELKTEGIDTEIFWIENNPLSGCISCWKCEDTGRCFRKDRVNEFLDRAAQADGFIFGTPVHFASASGGITSFMDRIFYADLLGTGNKTFYMKPASVVVSARRGGTTAAFDQMIKWLTISQMPMVSSRYWNMVHGTTPEEVHKDEEGMYTMRVLGRNMAYILKCMEAGRKANIPLPEQEQGVFTNFIRE